MAISAIGGAAAYQAYQGASAASAARSASARSPSESQPVASTPPTRPLEDRVTLSSAVQAPKKAPSEDPVGQTQVGEAARASELGTGRRQSALDALKDQSRVIAQDIGGQAAGRLHVVA